MRVFVTGVAGFLGSHMAERFRDLGHEVRGIDNFAGGEPGNLPLGVEFRELDCLDRSSYVGFMAGSDVVYPCAAAAYDGLSVFSPAYVFRNTAQATVEVATAAVATGVGRFVHCSSMARYGDLPTPYTEDQKPAPATPYGHAKWASELMVGNLFDRHGGEWSIAVPHNIIGPRQKYDDPFRNVASIMINLMLQKRQPIIYSDGKQQRCFSFIDDCLYCLKEMAFRDNVVGQVINQVPDEEIVTIMDLATRIANQLRFNLNPVFLPGRPQEVTHAICSSDKARKLLDYKTAVDLDDGLSEMIKYVKHRGTRPFKYHIDLEIVNERTPKTWTERLF